MVRVIAVKGYTTKYTPSGGNYSQPVYEVGRVIKTKHRTVKRLFSRKTRVVKSYFVKFWDGTIVEVDKIEILK